MPRYEAVYEDRAKACSCKKPAEIPVVDAAAEKPYPVAERCAPYIRLEKDMAKFEACKRISDEIGPIDSPKKAFKILHEAVGPELQEVFVVMALDVHMGLLGLAETGMGNISDTPAPVIPSLRIAIAQGATSVVIAHVHPSGGETGPSEADDRVTQAFDDACKTVDILLMDHIIVTSKSYYSYVEAGKLK